MDMTVPGRLTWADVPALLLASVSAVTVTTGARLLRGQNPLLMLVLGLGVAGATFVLDKLLVERLNAMRPRQSFVSLLACWLPLFLFATALSTLTTFSWLVPEIAKRDLEDSRRAHWAHEADKVANYMVLLKSAVRKQADTTAGEIDAERRRVAAARREGAQYSTEALGAAQRRLGAAKDMDRRIAAFQPLPVEQPADPAAATAQLDRVFRDLADVHATALLVTPHPPALPAYEPLAPPSSDLQSVVAEETKKRSWRAVTAWSAAGWVELLPLLALWRGGKKVSLAVRVLQWRSRVTDTIDALLGRRVPTPLPIVIEPLHVRGIVRVAMPSNYTLTDCGPLLEEAVDALTPVLGPHQLSGIAAGDGARVDEHLPLLPQLNGAPLVLSVVEDRA
jgi:hypothetical protein